MMSHQENAAALVREREARKTAYLAALTERDALPADAPGRRLANARLGLALSALQRWCDPIPAASAPVTVTAPAAPLPPLRTAAGVVNRVPTEAERVEAIARRIIESAEAASA